MYDSVRLPLTAVLHTEKRTVGVDNYNHKNVFCGGDS